MIRIIEIFKRNARATKKSFDIFSKIDTPVLLFLSPVFYPLSILPEKYQGLLQLNPLAFIIEEGRKVLIFGQLPDLRYWSVMMIASLLMAWAGFAWFQKTRKGFADVL